MKTPIRKALAAAAAVAMSVAVATTAYADPEPSAPIGVPDPQGPGCDAFKTALPNFKNFANEPVGNVLASIPDISTFNQAISGQLNPAVNVVGVLNNGPYVVFAPSNEAFAKLPPGQLEALKNDPKALMDMDYYHVFLGLLFPGEVNGQRPTQQGAEINVTGKDGDITVNNTAKVVCGGIQAKNAVVYIIDEVLHVSNAPLPGSGNTTTTTTTSTTDDTTTTTPTTSTEPTTPTPTTETTTPTPTLTTTDS